MDRGVWTEKPVKTTPATTSTSSIRQLLGAADAHTAHDATFSTAPAHQQLGSANADTTPARAPAAAADRKQRPDATCEGGPCKETTTRRNVTRGAFRTPRRWRGGRGFRKWAPRSKSEVCLLLPSAEGWKEKMFLKKISPTCVCSKLSARHEDFEVCICWGTHQPPHAPPPAPGALAPPPPPPPPKHSKGADLGAHAGGGWGSWARKPPPPPPTQSSSATHRY